MSPTADAYGGNSAGALQYGGYGKGGSSELPFTGLDIGLLVVFSIALILVGVLLRKVVR